MTIPYIPPMIDVGDLDVVSRCIGHFRAADLSLNLVNGQVGTFSRGATATQTDTAGVASFTAANAMARFEPRDWANAGTRGQMGLLMGTSDRLTFVADWRPRSFAVAMEIIEAGTVGIASAALTSVSVDTLTGARVAIDSTGTYYRIRAHNGTTEVTATLAIAPTAGQRVRIRAQVYADGSVQLWQSINEGAETFTARSAANAFAGSPTWGVGAKWRLNSYGTGNGGSMWLRRAKLVPGIPDAATLARLF